MSENFEEFEKDSASNASTDPKATRSDELPNRGKERRRSMKKKMLRSGHRRRLSGGADQSGSNNGNDAPGDDRPAGPQEARGSADSGQPAPGTAGAEDQQSEENATRQGDGTENSNEGRPLATTGDPRVDEMLDCALQNLGEAGRALATLGENLEHELKLFLVELMGRSRKWMNQGESKIDWARKDILNLHRELSSRISALEDYRRESLTLKEQLNSSETAKAIAQKSLTETLRNGQRYDQTGTYGDGDLNSGALSQARSAQLGRSTACNTGPGGVSRCPSRAQLVRNADGTMSRPDMTRADEERLQACCEELEAEVMELRKENERIVKERAEYENAIQRALLKGVSSLNAEALKVLRCTPIPNCCSPCPPTSSIEPVSKSRDCSSPQGGSSKSPCGNNNNNNKDNCNSGRNANPCKSRNGSREGLNSGGGRKQCPNSGHHQERKQRKSKDNNMLLLLHQKDADNFGIQTGSNCCDNSPKKSTGCSGGNCGKSAKSSYMC